MSRYCKEGFDITAAVNFEKVVADNANADESGEFCFFQEFSALRHFECIHI